MCMQLHDSNKYSNYEYIANRKNKNLPHALYIKYSFPKVMNTFNSKLDKRKNSIERT